MTSAEQERREILAEVRRRREQHESWARQTMDALKRGHQSRASALLELADWIEARGEPKHASDGFEGRTLTGPELIAKLRDNMPPAGTEHPLEEQ